MYVLAKLGSWYTRHELFTFLMSRTLLVKKPCELVFYVCKIGLFYLSIRSSNCFLLVPLERLEAL